MINDILLQLLRDDCENIKDNTSSIVFVNKLDCEQIYKNWTGNLTSGWGWEFNPPNRRQTSSSNNPFRSSTANFPTRHQAVVDLINAWIQDSSVETGDCLCLLNPGILTGDYSQTSRPLCLAKK